MSVDPLALRAQVGLRGDAQPDSSEFLRFVIRLSEAMNVDIPPSHYARLTTAEGCLAYLGA